MNNVRLSMDMVLMELFEVVPESRNFLMDYGLKKLIEEDVLDVLGDKLSVNGLFRISRVPEEEKYEVWNKIVSLAS
ncbi:MAG: hypothetical protein ACP5UF_00735 [Hydrogenobaculum sp.]